MFFDPIYLIFVFAPAALFGMFAQMRVKSAFNKYKRVRSSSGLTGAQAAYHMLQAAGLEKKVGIERVGGFLSDHYDPRKKVLRLSPEIHDQPSIAAVGVACHEAGHAIQDARKYAPLVLRNAIVPTAGIGSNFGFLLIFIGALMSSGQFTGFGGQIAIAGFLLFGAVVLFQFVNLPVEFDASARAKEMLPQLGIISGPVEQKGVNTVLNAAALTYVAATVAALLNLLYYAWIIFGNRRD